MSMVISKKTENRLMDLIPLAAVIVYTGIMIYAVCKDHYNRCRQRDLEQMELGIKIGSALMKGFEDVGIDTKQNGPAKGQKGQQTEEVPVGHEGGGEETV